MSKPVILAVDDDPGAAAAIAHDLRSRQDRDVRADLQPGSQLRSMARATSR